MSLFFISAALLIVGYFTYGVFVDRLFKPDANRMTPAYAHTDGVDFVPMKWPNIFLIQLLNIAGLGPIFGALAGALWGPAAFIWIVFGCLFGGAAHDYLSGMISLRNKGASSAEITGFYLGPTMKTLTRLFTLMLMVLVGAVFVTGPAKLLADLTPAYLNFNFWMIAIFLYYVLATLLPIDQLIGRIYPVFGLVLVIMAVGIVWGLVAGGYTLPALTLENIHPKSLPVWPLMFISIACGAISGFHATQSPMMARCIKNERQGRRIFYGSMVAEGLIALIWAAAGMAFYHGTPGLADAMKASGPGGVVHTISITLLGKVGGALAILGVIACPITTGDTAFRGARLMVADIFKADQKPLLKRLYLAGPLFIVGGILTQINFDIIWRYFAWANQTLAVITLWACAVYLVRCKKLHWVASLPATFMTAVSITYLLQAPEGFRIPVSIAYPLGAAMSVAVLGVFLAIIFPKNHGLPVDITDTRKA
ncbi:MAG: carbon starvation protein A [Opitutaceae bacterium]|nr:carbon starvation protein A [Opitutaceae bacterium]